MTVLPIAYFPPVSYFSLLAGGDVFLERFESYKKQTWRNRCRILAANGPLDLHFPIVHDGTRLITDIRIDWKTDWLSRHKRAIDSAYRSSPFFEFYRDELYALMDNRPDTLWEFDKSIIDFFVRKMSLPEPGVTDSFILTSDDITPKNELPPVLREGVFMKPYVQVFSDKFGFVENLSVMDYLFNEGV